MSPAHWLYGGHGNDAGFEDLQTDVMRFMAILAFCLMAVFALVQSFPLTAQPPPVASAADATAHPVVSPNAPQAAAKAAPLARSVVATPDTVPVADPAPVAAPDVVPVETPPVQATTQDEKPQGFTLRFVSDAALRRLVSRGKVGLYAVSAGNSWRLAASAQSDTFHSVPAPKQFHAMAAQTVPHTIVSALYQQAGVSQASVEWGVTLPPPTRYAIARLVREFDSGVLIIASDGRVEREER